MPQSLADGRKLTLMGLFVCHFTVSTMYFVLCSWCLHKLGQYEDRKSLITCLSDCSVPLQTFLHANTLTYDARIHVYVSMHKMQRSCLYV